MGRHHVRAAGLGAGVEHVRALSSVMDDLARRNEAMDAGDHTDYKLRSWIVPCFRSLRRAAE